MVDGNQLEADTLVKGFGMKYSSIYSDDRYEYSHVVIPLEMLKILGLKYVAGRHHPCGEDVRLLQVTEWQALGIKLHHSWENYAVHKPEPQVLLFRRKVQKSHLEPFTSAADKKCSGKNDIVPQQEQKSCEKLVRGVLTECIDDHHPMPILSSVANTTTVDYHSDGDEDDDGEENINPSIKLDTPSPIACTPRAPTKIRSRKYIDFSGIYERTEKNFSQRLNLVRIFEQLENCSDLYMTKRARLNCEEKNSNSPKKSPTIHKVASYS